MTQPTGETYPRLGKAVGAFAVLLGTVMVLVGLWAAYVLFVGGNLPLIGTQVAPSPVWAAAWLFIGVPVAFNVVNFAVKLLLMLVMFMLLPFSMYANKRRRRGLLGGVRP